MINFRTSGGIDLELTDHANRRIQQRGISREAVAFVTLNADIQLHAGEGCQSLRISRQYMAQLSNCGARPTLMERSQSVVVLIHQNENKIVTVLHDWGTRCGRRYRKQWPTKNKRHSRRSRQALNRRMVEVGDLRSNSLAASHP
jgi:hypothetical protein